MTGTVDRWEGVLFINGVKIGDGRLTQVRSDSDGLSLVSLPGVLTWNVDMGQIDHGLLLYMLGILPTARPRLPADGMRRWLGER